MIETDAGEKWILEVGMKQRIVSLGVALLLLLATMSLSGCIDKSKWRAKEYGGPPNWEEDFGRPGYDW
jgi:hypothetical protein